MLLQKDAKAWHLPTCARPLLRACRHLLSHSLGFAQYRRSAPKPGRPMLPLHYQHTLARHPRVHRPLLLPRGKVGKLPTEKLVRQRCKLLFLFACVFAGGDEGMPYGPHCAVVLVFRSTGPSCGWPQPPQSSSKPASLCAGADGHLPTASSMPEGMAATFSGTCTMCLHGSHVCLQAVDQEWRTICLG